MKKYSLDIYNIIYRIFFYINAADYEWYTTSKPVTEPLFFLFGANNAAKQLSHTTEPNLTRT